MEFSINYINRITMELGPLFYHSCICTSAQELNIHKLCYEINVSTSSIRITDGFLSLGLS